ncbi:MAG TPA: glycosyltransferase family 39 protein, partial [Acidimicrobiales bacterium]|nr:glycosyltransferase family 39 protein [Acidimicrobiales bacterium]
MNVRRLQVWRSPPDQPPWARPTLLGIAAASAVMYGWGAGRTLEVYYAAAVRSMAMSWHNFVFASFDPAGTVTLDKLPGAFWVQALSVRLFGVHEWAIILPQVVEGTTTVLVLYHAVRRLAGPVAAIAAALVLAVAPATVALDRGNISDTAMVLLVVLAADAMVSALTRERVRSLVLVGLWVGLAFQTKMIEAWLVLPPLVLAYLVAAPGTWRRRLTGIGAVSVVTAAVSLSWMTVVSLVPTARRPYVDGSQTDSLFHQVFVYNGFGRLDQASPNQLLTQAIGIGRLTSAAPTWDRLFAGSFGRDTGWMLPAAFIALVIGLVARRGRPREDLVRAGLIMWGGWLLVLTLVFTASSTINSYYTAALSPAVGAVLGIGVVQAWEHRTSMMTRLIVAGVVLITAGYAAWLLPAAGTGVAPWLAPVVVIIGLAAATGVVAFGGSASTSHGARAAIGACAIAVLLVPAVASTSIVANRLGPFDTPFQPVVVTNYTRLLFGRSVAVAAGIPILIRTQGSAPDLLATQTSALAAPYIYQSGREVLPIGGFTGTIP